MTNKIFGLVFVVLVATSCIKDDIITGAQNKAAQISFTSDERTSELSSRGAVVDDINKVSRINVYAFATGNTPAAYIENKPATMGADNVWRFSPAYYYPISETLDFLAYTPAPNAENGLTIETYDFATKSITFCFQEPNDGKKVPDFMLAPPQKDKSLTNKLSSMQLKHAFAQLTMSAKVGAGTETGRYTITKLVINNIATHGHLNYSVDGGIGTWIEKNKDILIISETIDSTLKLGNGDFENIMIDGQTAFVIPQAIEGKSGDKPTLQITIHDTKEGSDLVYRTEPIALPTPSHAGWIAGRHVNLRFAFDVTNEDLVIPMTLTARLNPWNEVLTDTDIDANIYAYLSDYEIVSGSSVTLYTNGEVKKVIQGATLGTKGTNSYQLNNVTENIIVEIKNSHEKTITKTFNISLK